MSDSATTRGDDLASVAKAVWWLVLIRGILAILFGILALVLPGVALLALVFTFAAYAVIDGVTNIAHSVRVRNRDKRWGWLLAQGILSVLAGLIAFIFPFAAAFVFGLWALVIIGIYAIMMGISGIPAAASVVDGGRKVFGFIVAILSILFGIAILVIAFASPLSGIGSLVWVIGVYAIIFGLFLIVAAIQARRGVSALADATTPPKAA
jgi:uncharacterized membrane protein HdeD (DUF308 family)